LPAKKQERKIRLAALQRETRTLVFYEAPHRLKESLDDILCILGDREIVIARELTKLHEEFLRGAVSDVIERLAERAVKGEVTILVHGSTGETEISDEQLRAEIGRLIDGGSGVKEISEALGARYGIAKREIYRLALAVKNSKRSGERSG
jgi:16S rRNA (cytidine1402-2'-O)-methyltransferase